MPFPLIPLAIGGLSALGGLFGNRNRQNTESSSTGQTSSTGTNQSTFDQTTTQGFAPGFEGTANQVLQNLFSTLGPTALNPDLLNTQELVAKQRVNQQADRLFGNLRGDAFSKGLQFSPSSEGFARGLSEMFRGQGISDVAGNFAQRRFELPIQQANLNAQRNAQLAQIFGLLPRTSTSTGSSGSEFNQTGTSSQTGSSQTTSRQGNPIINAISGGLGGFGMAGGFNSIPGLSNLFGQNPTGETAAGSHIQYSGT